MNVKLVLGILGRLLTVYALTMAVPLTVSAFCADTSWRAFFITILITGLSGLIMMIRGSQSGRMGLREGFFIVAAAWLLTSLYGALPFFLTQSVPTYIDAVFETASGLTTTGASIINDVEILSPGILLWRSLTHWLGGMGIIVLFIVLLPNIGTGAVHLFNAEVPGPIAERVLPRIRDTAVTLWKIYTVFTLVEIALLVLAGLTFFDAVNHAFATLATGGFSTKNASIKHFDNLAVELIIVLFMFLAGGNFAIYLQAWRKKTFKPFRNTEFKVYLLIILGATLIIAGNLWLTAEADPGSALRLALFQVVSIMTTTGFATANFDEWPSLAKFILFILMFIGGSAGSTAGGIKVSRLVLLSKAAWAELIRGIHPRVVISIKSEGKNVDPATLNTITVFFFLYVSLFTAATVLLAGTGLEPFDAMSAVAATLGNIGPGFGVVGPTTTYAGINLFGKTILTLCMLLGRLELFTLLILIRPEFWRTHRSW